MYIKSSYNYYYFFFQKEEEEEITIISTCKLNGVCLMNIEVGIFEYEGMVLN